ncbi:MAG: hypothetical protein MJ191_00150 [Clostridium sp.]|nr:hypothetical protein [Clostridium sp.]
MAETYRFPKIAYDPTEKARGIVTADEWNQIMLLLRNGLNTISEYLNASYNDRVTLTDLGSTEAGNSGSKLVGIDPIPGLEGCTNVNDALRTLRDQLDQVVLGQIPDGSITGDKLMNNINITKGITINGVNILTQGSITQNTTGTETNKVPSVNAVKIALAAKQNKILSGTAAPSGGVDGDVYLQYV